MNIYDIENLIETRVRELTERYLEERLYDAVSDVLAAQVPDTGFTVQQLLQGMAALMPHTVVVTGG